MFYGKFRHSIDDKGRLIVPSKFREQLGALFFVTTDLWRQENQKRLYVYPQETFFELRDKLRTLPRDEETRKFLLQYFSNVQDTSLDKQGRVLIDADLRDYAHLEKDVVFVGMDEHIEIWNKDDWDAYNNTDSGKMGAALAESLGALGI